MEDYLKDKLERIERLSLLAAKEVLTVEDAALLMGVSTHYIYKMTSGNIIPYYRPNGKNIYIKKQDLEDWMCQNRIPSNVEINAQAARIIASR